MPSPAVLYPFLLIPAPPPHPATHTPTPQPHRTPRALVASFARCYWLAWACWTRPKYFGAAAAIQATSTALTVRMYWREVWTISW